MAKSSRRTNGAANGYAVAGDVKDLRLAREGRLRIEWADRHMPVLRQIRARFAKQRPLKGIRIAACLHVTTETANLARTLQAGGAEVFLCGSNPLSTQDDVAAALVTHYGIATFAIKGEDHKTYYSHILSCIEARPHLTMDDGCDLVTVLHTKKKNYLRGVFAGTEETSTGVTRLRAMAATKVLRYPVVAINDADTKHLFDNRYGTGQSTIDGILRATNMLIAGSTVVIAGYGWCGRGVANRAKGMGATVLVTEINPLRALEAAMDGFQVVSMADAAPRGDLFVTLTGNKSVLRREHFLAMKDGAIIANSGHFNVEIDIPALERLSGSRRTVRTFVEEFRLKGGKRVFLLGEGRLINLAAAEGHPAMVMDMSFANQALSVEFLRKKAKSLKREVFVVPAPIDKEVARLKLASMNVAIDTLTPEQDKYMRTWSEGT
ncbi:MAG: adenosylhomocysteinase [Candidatus Eisenbacteria bacterium]|uniref:Adenosylhomocysteinase n=1 Tax=Eiseniibacteriota bacterium TaxID=2212470 RepID=A0A9D6L9B2_UNCEI|nr:adenosylhomocysteinase [Candidatus Eisenbacteria bacterium]MBI3539350.1 adenosylhomocysteinase [Candidatus Eisenbacteria bacterium]